MTQTKFLLAIVLALASITASAQSDWQARKDRENAATSAGSITNNRGQWDAQAQAERERQSRQSQPALVFTSCDSGFCYDNQGGVWHKNGPNYLNGPNGRTCNLSGGFWSCN